MSDLTQGQWHDIIKHSALLPQEAHECLGRYIALNDLRNIIRKSRRTTTQNALLWALYNDIIALGGEDLRGFTRDDLHEFFLIEHFGSEVADLFGRKRLKPLRRSSRLTKTEFGEFLDFIVQFMAERGVVLSLPGDIAA